MITRTIIKAAALSLLLSTISASCAADKKPAEATPAEQFPLPSISASVTNPTERASIASSRFWDEAVLAPGVDTVTPALEQAMANFISIAALGADPDSIARGVRTLLSKAPEEMIMPLAEHYLYDPNSPMRSEETFLIFLEEAPRWVRSEALREQVMKNRVGTLAADFPYVTSKGRRSTLGEFVREHGETAVYFFDSECEVCKALIPSAQAAAAGRPVLAVCPEVNADSLESVLPLFPADWTVARDLGKIDSEDLYIFPALPSLYIIAPDRRVIAKDEFIE